MPTANPDLNLYCPSALNIRKPVFTTFPYPVMGKLTPAPASTCHCAIALVEKKITNRMINFLRFIALFYLRLALLKAAFWQLLKKNDRQDFSIKIQWVPGNGFSTTIC